jgi:hypothetical protein
LAVLEDWPAQAKSSDGERATEGENIEKTGKVSGGERRFAVFFTLKREKPYVMPPVRVVEETFFELLAGESKWRQQTVPLKLSL